MKKEKSVTKKTPDKTITDKKPAAQKNNKTSEIEHFPIVGIGASAGGLEALEQFFKNMPENSGMAFVIIQHLDPNHVGIMPELIQRVTKMKIIHVSDRLKIRPDSVYVIPPNKSMSILNGSLHLFDPVEIRGLRLPIDYFFRSLAEDRLENSIGIILSGMGSDGSLGLKAIKEKAGLALVQDPESAKFDSMPRSAIESVMADIIAPANELPEKLLAIARLPLRKISNIELEKDTSSLEKIILLLRSHTGNDFSQYKKNTLYRRIERRMGIHQISKIGTYVRYLQENSAETDILFKELLIGVTSFFRDDAVWDNLRDIVLPGMFAEFPHGYVLRAWIPACSTGEEAYSLAIIFKEAIEKTKLNKNLSIQIFATDLDTGAIEQARKGLYPSNIVSDVSANRLSRFFVKVDDQFRVNAEIREMVVFAPQNVIKDPPFTKLDILSCRNMLIYMDTPLQKKLLALFHYSLNPGGVLLLGNAETNGDQKDLFTIIDSKLRIFKSVGTPKTEELFNFPSSFSTSRLHLTQNPDPIKIPDNLQTLTDQIVLQKFSPASVLVTGQGDILYITGNTGKYLTPSAGKASMNIFSMAREGLRNLLPAAFRKAGQNYEKVTLHNVKIGTNGGTQIADITIQQIESPSALKGKIIVVFNDLPAEKPRRSKSKTIDTSDTIIVEELKLELRRTHEELQSTREEMQTSQEELKSTNEELQSSNEELQSTNEELTTSKEEMQSLNEELHTVNAELLSKVDDSARVNNDMTNLLNSDEIATLFLDKKLNIRQFTPSATKIFKLIQSDIGRVFTDLVTVLNYPEISSDGEEVLRTLMFKEKEVTTIDGRWFIVRIMPYRTIDDKIDGLVITFIEITKPKTLEFALKDTLTMLSSLIYSVRGVVLGLSSDGKVIEFNPQAEKLFGKKRNEVIGNKYTDMFIPEQLRGKVEAELKNLIAGEFSDRFENIVLNAHGNEIKVEWSAHKLYNEAGIITGIITIGENITPPLGS